jgi:hypothetical protein
MNKKTLIIQEILPNYRIPVFDRIANLSSDSVTVFYCFFCSYHIYILRGSLMSVIVLFIFYGNYNICSVCL